MEPLKPSSRLPTPGTTTAAPVWTLVAPALLLAPALGIYAFSLVRFWNGLSASEPQIYSALLAAGVGFKINGLIGIFGLLSAFLLIVGVSGFVWQRPVVRSLLRKAYGMVPLTFALLLIVLNNATGIILHKNLLISGMPQDRVTLFYISWNFVWPLLPAVLVAIWAHIQNLRAGAVYRFDGEIRPGRFSWSDPVLGDRIMEDLRTNGKDPCYRKSTYASILGHGFILLLPLLFQMFGCVERYKIPKGSGEPVAAVVQVVKREVTEQERMILRPDAAIIFDRPELDDTKLLEEMMEETMLTYVADTSAVAGRIGQGGGKEGGWPDGMEDGTVRFIRLEYNGPGWNNAMGPGEDSDINFLRTFGTMTGLRVSNRNESHNIRHLGRYARGYAPPFVFMTGHGNISISTGDLKVLRKYLDDGGMLFASAGSPQWHREFLRIMGMLYPEENLRLVSDDDPIFQQPYYFPNGAPPLWHHGGRRAMGIRKEGRWVVFYHPGDIQDAWRTDHSGLSPELAERAAQLGVNIIYYAFTQYLELTKEDRK